MVIATWPNYHDPDSDEDPQLEAKGVLPQLKRAFAGEAVALPAIQYDPNNRTAHYLLAQLLQQMGRTEEAKLEFAIAEKLPK